MGCKDVFLFWSILDTAVNFSPQGGYYPLQGDIEHTGTQTWAWSIDYLFLQLISP